MTLHPALGAVILVLIGNASFDDSHEMVARWSGHEVRWSLKTGSECFDLAHAIEDGFIVDVPPSAALTCTRRPGLFTPRSNCIPGYHGPRKEGRCR